MGKVGFALLWAACAGVAHLSFAAEPEGVRVSERFGYDPADSTRFIQRALESGLPCIVLDRQDGPWVTKPLWGRSNQRIVIPDGVELVAKRGEFRRQADMLLTFKCATNVTLCGGGTIRMWFEDYTNKTLYGWSEWRHAVALYSCANVRVENLRIADSGGDGLYLGAWKSALANTDVTVRNVTFSRNNRQGISVISAERLLVDRCVMETTCGTPPMAGIDFEPNMPDERLVDIVVRDSVVRGNRGAGFDFSVGNLGVGAPPISILLENCRSEGNRNPTKFHQGANLLRGFKGSVKFRNCTFDDADKTRRTFRSETGPQTMSVTFENCRAADPERDGALTELGPDYGWKRLPDPSWEDGVPMRMMDWTPEALAHAKVCDASPGRAVRVPSFCLRERATYMVYAAGAGKLSFKAKVRQVGRQPFKGCKMSVWALDGRKLDENASVTESFGREFDFAFTAPAKGFYWLDFSMGSHVLSITETTAPIAAVSGRDGRFPHWNGFEGEAYLRIPEGCRRFAVGASGGGGMEFVRAQLVDPKGRLAWDRDNVGATRIWRSGEDPTPGVWTIRAKKPTDGCLDDFSFEIVDLRSALFLSAEKTWE